MVSSDIFPIVDQNKLQQVGNGELELGFSHTVVLFLQQDEKSVLLADKTRYPELDTHTSSRFLFLAESLAPTVRAPSRRPPPPIVVPPAPDRDPEDASLAAAAAFDFLSAA